MKMILIPLARGIGCGLMAFYFCICYCSAEGIETDARFMKASAIIGAAIFLASLSWNLFQVATGRKKFH
ncbi:MAG: hypothetical protein JWO73_790 [Candidatus Taylorbacteria bacterium]|nr:hypothetical protein [Candidatus Taylorbacteria bacterium]